MAYRFRVWDSEASGGSVRLKVTDEKDVDGTYAPIEDGARYVVFEAAAMLAITNDDGLTDQQKLGALAVLFRSQVESWNIGEAEEAVNDITALVGSFPVTVDF